DHDNGDRRSARRHEADKRRVVFGLRITSVDQLPGCPGFAGDRESRNLRGMRGAMLGRYDTLHDGGHRRRSVWRDDAPLEVRRNDETAVVAVDGVDDARLDVFTAVCDRADRGDDLQRRHANLVAHGHGCEAAVVQLFRLPDLAGTLSGKIARDRMAEPVESDVPAEPFRAELEADLD